MPRVARKKSEESMYHVMSRSISEIDLFQSDEDKSYYLDLLKRYKEKFHLKIYAYCLMNNHVHIYINPCGYDISNLMSCLNTAYVVYYNKRYNRHGHLFQGRFASKIVHNNTYSLTLAAYINNNAKDIPGYDGKEELYRYSSYGIYTGHRADSDDLVDVDFLLKQFSDDKKIAREKFRIFTETMKDTGIIKEVDENITRAYTQNEYRSEKHNIVRHEEPEKLIEKIGELLGENIIEKLKNKT